MYLDNFVYLLYSISEAFGIVGFKTKRVSEIEVRTDSFTNTSLDVVKNPEVYRKRTRKM